MIMQFSLYNISGFILLTVLLFLCVRQNYQPKLFLLSCIIVYVHAYYTVIMW